MDPFSHVVKVARVVYLTIDNSGSFSGPKMDQVVTSLKETMRCAPPQTKFVIRFFSGHEEETVIEGFTEDLSSLELDVTNFLGQRSKEADEDGCCCLYDAWAETFRQIPVQSMKMDKIYIGLVTSSPDTASTRETLDTVVSLVNDNVKDNEKVHFNFIQVGLKVEPTVTAELYKIVTDRLHCITVEDSKAGIVQAFETMQHDLGCHFEHRLAKPHGHWASRWVKSLWAKVNTFYSKKAVPVVTLLVVAVSFGIYFAYDGRS